MKYLGIAAMLFAVCDASASMLVDYRPASVNSTGYAVGTSFYQWEIYQSFSVTDAAGWHLDSISLGGFRSAGVNSGDVLVEVAKDATSAALASTMLTITNTNAGANAYVSGAIDVNLMGNTSYVLRVKSGSTSPYTDVGIYYGANGPAAVSKNASGFTRTQATAIAATIEGSVVPAPASAAVLAVGGLVARRRRR